MKNAELESGGRARASCEGGSVKLVMIGIFVLFCSDGDNNKKSDR